ncbi:MAG: hypothetical protein LBN33_05565 [Desulfovibrio sp.]|jgi:hypothetical protein|nr:hypothetical protein [Desulfovibrio sp.]
MEKDTPSKDKLTEAGLEEQKRLIYEGLPQRRRKFVDRIGYRAWDPYAAPKEPLDMRQDETGRAARQLAQSFIRSRKAEVIGAEYERGARDCAAGLIAGEERYRGILDFCIWYIEVTEKF